MQHIGDLIVDKELEIVGQVTGLTTVRPGGHAIVRGQLSGGLIIEEGGKATVHGQVSRNVINHGSLKLLGQISGRLIGNPATNSVTADQIVGIDLEVPFRGQTWSSTTRA